MDFGGASVKFFAGNVKPFVALCALAAAAVGDEFPLEMVKLEPVVRVAQAPEPIPLPPVDGKAADNRLTLADAESLALAFHPALRGAGAELRAAQGKWLQVGLRPNPVIGYSGDEIGNEGKAGMQGGFVEQEFVTGGKLDLNRMVAFREQQAAEQRVERTRRQVLTTVRKFYFETLVAERALALTRQLNQIAGQSVTVSEQRLKAQDIPRAALLQSQIESESAGLLEQQARQRHEAAWRRLVLSIGKQDQQPAKLEDVLARPLPVIEFAAIRERVMNESPELAELRYVVDRARATVQRASVGKVPNLTVLGGAQFDNATEDTIANVQVSMPFPIFDRNQGAVAEACGQLAAAQAALEARELALDEKLSLAFRDYETARMRVTRYVEKILPAARETLDMTTNGYQQGELDYLQVLTVQQTYAAKNLSYLQDLETAWKQWAEIDGLLVGDLGQTGIDRLMPTTENAMDR
jgi:cobalt-zinc-cadmium efflux system outer membrane protein